MEFETKTPTTYLDAPFTYDTLAMDAYAPYATHSPYVGIHMGLPGISHSPSFDTLSLSNGLHEYGSYHASPAYTTTASPTRPFTPPDGVGISPALYNLSAGEMSSDGLPSGRRSRGSGTHSPASSTHGVSYSSTVPRSHRFNPIAAPASRRAPRRKASRDDDSDDEDEEFQPSTNNLTGSPETRRETIRKQRIESEQRRRDELREGYARLRETLPASNQKASKVSLLDRATTHIRYLDTVRDNLETRLKAAEAEVHRLRSVNEALMLGTAEQRHAAAAAAAVAASVTSY